MACYGLKSTCGLQPFLALSVPRDWRAVSTVIQWRYGDEILAIMALLVITITALDYLSSYVRNRLATGVV